MGNRFDDRTGRRRLAVLAVLALGACASAAADPPTPPAPRPDVRRYYVAVRFAESAPFSRAHDAIGLSVGAELTRYFGLELAADFYELFLEVPDVGKVGELATAAILPQVRARYPLLDDRVIPYAIAGAGLAVTQPNDETYFARGRSSGTSGVAFMGSIGGGLEWAIADDVRLGVEGKYLLSPGQTWRFGRETRHVDLDAALLSFSLRLLAPQLEPATAARPSGWPTLYLAVRAGGALPLHGHAFGPVETEPEPASIGPLDQLYGLALGLDVGPHFGVELPFEGFEMRLSLPGKGSIGEYALYAVVPQARVRWPLLDGALEPYAIGGVGISYGEHNDAGASPVSVRGNDVGVGAVLGGGIEYFVATNIALGVETRYLFAGGHELRVGNRTYDGNLDALFVNAVLRVYLWEFGRG